MKLVLKEFVGNVVKANFCFFFKRYIKQTINAKYKPATQFCSMPESEKLEIMSQLHIHQVCKLDYIRSSQHLFQFSFFFTHLGVQANTMQLERQPPLCKWKRFCVQTGRSICHVGQLAVQPPSPHGLATQPIATLTRISHD